MIAKNLFADNELIEKSEFKYNPVMRFYNYIGVSGAEWNYVVGAPANAVSSYSQLISPSASLGITFGWNYLDGLYAVGLGIIQLTDEDDYRTTRNQAKGLLNIVSGIQLFLFSYNPLLTSAIGLAGGAALAPSSFALTMLCDLITAAIDFSSAYKETIIDGWLDERKKEIQFNNDKLLELQNKLDKEKDPEEIKYLEAKCRILNRKNDELNRKVLLRTRVKNNHGTAADIQENNAIQNQLEAEYRQARINLFFKAASFVGMAWHCSLYQDLFPARLYLWRESSSPLQSHYFIRIEIVTILLKLLEML